MPRTQPKLEKASKEAEAVAERILTDPELSAVKRLLEKDHAIDCLLLLYLNRGKWKEAKAYMQGLGLTLSDGTFRARMIEIEHNNLAESHPIDPLKKYYTITEKGEKLVKLLIRLFEEL
jgi:DNA-binding HxlR family transcriptional regulator